VEAFDVSRLKDKLSRLGGPRSREVVQTPSEPPPHDGEHGDAERLSRLRAQIALLEQRKPKPKQPSRFARAADEHACERVIGAQLPGEACDTEHGPLRRVVTAHDEDHCHGSVQVALALEARARDLSILALDPTLEAVDFRRALYIDTETTGLNGGSGTIPFLVGMAWFEERRLIVEQLLLERPGQEAPILRRLAERMAWASCIVSYNGKSFDWPLLRTRFILNRVAAPAVPAHLDLLHCARRVYKRRLGAVRLVHLEEEVLGFTRIDDIPGELIPQTYLGFVRGHVPASALVPIIEHNRSDLVALSAMLGELTRRFSTEQEQDARDQLGFAQVAARAADDERAVLFAERAAEADVRGELAPQAHFLAGQMRARRGEVQGAIQSYLQSIEAAADDATQAARAHLALSKLFEHLHRDHERALAHAAHTAPIEGEDACRKRVARLEKRLRAASAARLV
jgi:uncharacterized protein YprB with RNaseH-like and TPR domain